MPRPLPLAAVLALAVLLLAGCAQPVGVGTDTTGPYDRSSVVNRDNQFVLSGQVGGLTVDHSYTWHTTQAQPTAAWSGHIEAGTLAVTVKDQLGQTLYQHTYAAGSGSSGSEQVQGTLGGDWSIAVSFHDATGSLSLVLQ